MKKLILSIVAISLAFMVYAQPVSDNAVIPVSVSLTGILRLNVTSGGNIEFQVNTLAQYTNGIANATRYDTHFTVASSTDFDVAMETEDANLIGTDDATHVMNLNNILYEIDTEGTGAVTTNYTIGSNGSATALVNASTNVIEGVGNESAGDIAKNAFVIHWALNNPTGGSGTLLSQNLASDRYSTNVFLTVKAK